MQATTRPARRGSTTAAGDTALRVALLSYRSKPHCGGQGVYVRHLSRELARLGHEVEVFSGPPYPVLDDGVRLTRVPSLDLYREPDPFRCPRPSEFHSSVDVLEFALMCTAGFPEPLTFSLRAERLLRRRVGDFDIVHDNQSLGYGLLGIQRSGVPVVATVHHPITVDRDFDLAAAPSLQRRLSLRRWYAFLRMQQRVARRIERLTTVSQASYADIVRNFGVAPERLSVIPVGVDTAVFHPLPAPRVPGRIVATGSADVPLKGLVTLLEAVAKVRTGRDAQLVVVGRPRAGGETEQAVERLGLHDGVRFVHGISEAELAALLGAASVAVVPSLYEGFSIPAIEAMACGTALVVTTAGALPEVVGPDGESALHVAPGDPGALAAAIEQVLDDPGLGARLGAAGRRRAVERYTWESTAARTAEWYRGSLPESQAVAAPRQPANRPC